MIDPTQKKPESRLEYSGESGQNSYVDGAASEHTDDVPDIQQPGPAGDFGNHSTAKPSRESKSTALPSKHSAGRTPGDQPELSRQSDIDVAQCPEDAAEAANTYSGT